MTRATLLAMLVVLTAGIAAAEDVLPPQIVHEPCEDYQKNKAFKVYALFYDDSPIFDPKVVYRTGKIKEWRSTSFTKEPGGDAFVATIKARDLKGALEYFIETFDENGNGPARFGSPDAPVRLAPAERASECNQTGEAAYDPLSSVDSSRPPPEEEATRESTGKGKKKRKKRRGSPAEEPTTTTPDTDPGDSGDPSAIAVGAEVPPPVKTGCDAEDPPIYCSPVLWTMVGIGVAAAATGGVLAWCYVGGPCKPTEVEQPIPQEVTIEITATDLNDVFGLRF